MKYIVIFVTALCLMISLHSEAAMSRLDFSGTVVGVIPSNGVGSGDSNVGLGSLFSGYYLLDTSVPDSDWSSTSGEYGGSVVGGAITIAGTLYTLPPGSMVGAVNIFNNASFQGDFFAVRVNSFSDSNNQVISLSTQFSDSSQLAFVDDSFPTSFDSNMFDDFVLDTINGTGFYFFINPNNGVFQGAYDFATLTSVPVPAVGWLLGVVLLGMWRKPRI